MVDTAPASLAELADALRDASRQRQQVLLEGNGSKRCMGGPLPDAAHRVSLGSLNRVLQFEPKDLTIRVEAGLPWAELDHTTRAQGLAVALDPPWAGVSTVGGVLACNLSGPRRRIHGAARDQVIGMTFVTAEGELVESGGMVVKNVAGLDLQKLLIGSFGTLAAIATVSFKLAPAAGGSLTAVFSFRDARSAVTLRDRILASVLQLAAIDVVNPAAARQCSLDGCCLLLQACGPEPVLARYRREFHDAQLLEDDAEAQLWEAVREFPARTLARQPDAALVRAGWPLPDLHPLLESTSTPMIARAGSGSALIAHESLDAADAWMQSVADKPWSVAVDYSPPGQRRRAHLWPRPGPDLELMQRLKQLFDPAGVLNPGRLYGRL